VEAAAFLVSSTSEHRVNGVIRVSNYSRRPTVMASQVGRSKRGASTPGSSSRRPAPPSGTSGGV